MSGIDHHSPEGTIMMGECSEDEDENESEKDNSLGAGCQLHSWLTGFVQEVDRCRSPEYCTVNQTHH